jgi:hypothetical protein
VAGTATIRPVAVVMSASEIPEATSFAFTCSEAAMASKALIMPDTVPRKPRSGARVVTDDTHTMPRSRNDISIVPAVEMAFSTASRPRSAFCRPEYRMAAIGPRTFWHSSAAA